MFPIVNNFVVPESLGLEVLLYSQDLIAKKKAPETSCDIATAAGSFESAYNSATLLITDTGIAFCLFSDGSSALKLASCLLIKWDVLLFSASVGSGKPFSMKVCANALRVFWIDPATSPEAPLVFPVSDPMRRSWAKSDSSWFL